MVARAAPLPAFSKRRRAAFNPTSEISRVVYLADNAGHFRQCTVGLKTRRFWIDYRTQRRQCDLAHMDINMPSLPL